MTFPSQIYSSSCNTWHRLANNFFTCSSISTWP